MGSMICSNCGVPIGTCDEAHPCPAYGSLDRTLVVADSGSIQSYEKVKGKGRRLGERPHREFATGDDLSTKTGEWNRLKRVIDRDKNIYFELVTNQAGDVIHYCEERLDQHRRHGSDKKQSPPPET